MTTQLELPVLCGLVVEEKPTGKPTTCPVLEAAYRLRERVEGKKLPDDWQPGPDDAYLQVLAEIRHRFTNYEELLGELPVCVDLWDSDECPDNPYYWDDDARLSREFDECPLAQQAHDVLKWAAKGVAQEIYEGK